MEGISDVSGELKLTTLLRWSYLLIVGVNANLAAMFALVK